MPKDVAGRSHPGAFEIIRDRESGLTFTPVQGRGNWTEFRVSGPGATGETLRADTRDPRILAHKAYMHGAAVPQMDPFYEF